MIYSFADFELDTRLFQLTRAGERIRLEPKAFNLRVYLIEHRDRVVPLSELHERLWPDEFVTNSAVTRAVRTVRQALGESGTESRFMPPCRVADTGSWRP